jgi:hypothetical protein
MSLVRLINENGTHIFLNCLNKNVAPGGSITVSEHDVSSNTEILSAIASGAFRKEKLEPSGSQPGETPAEVAVEPGETSPPSESDAIPPEDETVEVKIKDIPKNDHPESEKGYYVHDIDRVPSVEGKSFVKTRTGVQEGKSMDLSMPPHMIDRFGDPVKEKSVETEKREFVGGIEIVNPAPENPPSEMINGIEIIDTSNGGID